MHSVKINGALEGYFEARSGLRQGDPLSPYLFVIAMEVLNACIKKCTGNAEFSHHWRTKEMDLTHLAFADDLFLFCKGDSSSIKLLLEGIHLFSSFSGMQANPSKSSCCFGNVDDDTKAFALNLSGFVEGNFPFVYLGLPITSGKLSARYCDPLVSKICRRIGLWTCKSLSQAGRLQLIKSILFNIQSYWAMYMFLPAMVIKHLQRILSKFLWRGDLNGSCIYKIAWKNCCSPQSHGGLGLNHLCRWNDSAVIYQIWRIINRYDSIWVDWIYHYELKRSYFWTRKIPSKCSWCWRKILSMRAVALPHLRYKVGCQSNFSLWHDPWCNGTPLSQQFDSSLRVALESDDQDTVSLIQDNGSWNLGISNFYLVCELRLLCQNIVPVASDKITWEDGAAFPVKVSTIYSTLCPSLPSPPWLDFVWNKFRVPRYAFTAWLALQERLLTKDRMRNFLFTVDQTCVLCSTDSETHQHLFCNCSYTRIVLSACPGDIHYDWDEFKLGRFLPPPTSRIKLDISHLYIAAVFYEIWRERNFRIHNSKRRLPSGIIALVKNNVREKLYSCMRFQRIVSRDNTITSLLY